MDKVKLKFLEKAFSAEIEAALSKKFHHVLQTKSKIAEELVEDGFLRKVEINLGGAYPVTIRGYELTHAGRYEYGASC